MVLIHLNLNKNRFRVDGQRLRSIRCVETSLSVCFVTNIAQDFPLEKHQKTSGGPAGELKRSPIPPRGPSREKGEGKEKGPGEREGERI